MTGFFVAGEDLTTVLIILSGVIWKNKTKQLSKRILLLKDVLFTHEKYSYYSEFPIFRNKLGKNNFSFGCFSCQDVITFLHV